MSELGLMELAEKLKAIAEPTRLRILNLIIARGPELCVCDLVAVLKLPQSTISRHLMTFRHLGLLSARRDGLWMNYSLSPGGQKGASAGPLFALVGACCAKESVCKEDLKRYDQLHKRNAIVRCQQPAKRSPHAARR